MDFESQLIGFGYSTAFFIELLVLVGVAKIVKEKLSGYAIDNELTLADNAAVSVSFAGYVAGLLIALSGLFVGYGTDSFVNDLASVGLWGLFSIVSLNVMRLLIDNVLLKGFGNVDELVRDRNVGVGACEAGGYLASGLIIRSAVAGEGAAWLGPAFLVMGVVFLLVGGFVLRDVVFRKFDLKNQIEADNHAAGVLYGLHLLAVGYIVSDVLERMELDLAIDAGTVPAELGIAALTLFVGLLGLALLVFLGDRLMLGGDKLRSEIVEDRNTGAAIVAGAIAIAGALAVMTVY